MRDSTWGQTSEGDRRTHLRIRGTYLQIRERRTELSTQVLRDKVGDDSRETDRGIEDPGIYATDELRRLVRTTRKRQIERVAPSKFSRSKDCEVTLTRRGLRATALELIGIGEDELIRDKEEVSTKALTLIVILFIRRTEGSRQIDILSNRGIVVRHKVHILLLEVADIRREVTERLREYAGGRSIELRLTLSEGVIQTSTPREVDLLIQLILQRAEEHVAVIDLGVQIAVCYPVGVLHVHTHATGLPLLYIVPQLCVVALEVLLLVEVLTTRIEISTYDRIEVCPVGDHVVRIVTDVVSRDVQRQLIIEELRRIANRSIVAMVLIVGYDPLSIDSRGREIGLILIRTNREVERVIERHATVVEVAYLIGGRSSELITP